MSRWLALLTTPALPRRFMPGWSGRARYASAMAVALRMWLDYRRTRATGRRHGAGAAREALQAAHQRNAVLLTELCRANGAVWVKFAQFLSCRPDLLPQQYVNALATLQNGANPVPFSALQRVLDQICAKGWLANFSYVDPVPVATGSVGQVHRARLADGIEVAVKIRLPDAMRYFKRDFFMLRLFARTLAWRVPYLDLRQIVEELMRAVADELDFSIEQDNLRQFAGLPMHERTRIPRTFPALCSSAVLVTEWVPGTVLAEVIALDRSQAHDLLRVLMDSYVLQITRNGYYHVDPHPGNFIVDANNNLWLLDFGAVGQLSREQTRNYRMLLARLVGLSDDDLGALLTNAGFHGGDPQTVAGLSEFFIGTRRRGRRTESDLGEIMQTLRRHRIEIPDSFVLMMRVLITLGGFMQMHGVRFNLLNMIAPMQQHRRKAAADTVLT